MQQIDADDVDRVVQGLMAEHEAASANVALTVFCGEPAIAVRLDQDTERERMFLVDEDGEAVTDQERADLRVNEALARVRGEDDEDA